MKEWEKLKIEELCSKVTSGGTPLRKKTEYYTGNIPWIKTGELKGWYIYNTDEMITFDAIKNSSAKLYPTDTILMAMYGDGRTIGSVGITGVEAASNQACCAMIPNKTKCDPYFLLFALQNYSAELVNLALGGAQRNLNQKTIRKFEITVPNIKVQNRIGEQLSNYNQLIENNTRRITILEEMARLIYREWFVHYKYPGHENDRLVDSGTELGEVPDGWGVNELGEVIEINKGKNITKNTSNTDGSVPVVAGGLEPAYMHDTPNTKHPVITVSASGANAGYVNLYEVDVWASDCSYIDKSASDDVYYFYCLMKERQHDIFHMQHGSAQPHVYPKDLDRLRITYPNEQIVKKFTLKATPIFRQIKVLNKQNRKLKETRDLLLPKLISGKVSV